MQKQLSKNKYKKGQAMLIVVVLFLFLSATMVFGIVNPILKQVAISKNIIHSNESYYTAESAAEDAYYRIIKAKNLYTTKTMSLNGGAVTSSITINPTNRIIAVDATTTSVVRKIQATAVLGTGFSFYYGIQSGQGGFVLQNSSSVTGNVYSSGTVNGTGNNIISGGVVSAGASGIIHGIHANGTAYSHTIQNSTIDGDAYYVTKTSTTVGGTSYPGSPDQPTIPLPISDAQVSAWESLAATGGSVTCSGGKYTISSATTTGPLKVPCDLEIKGNGIVVTVGGPIWVTGNITTSVSPTIKMAASLGASNVAIIADNPADRSGSGIITVGQNTVFQGSGTAGSFVFMLSQNNSAETGGSTDAISMGQGASALVVYASHGQITLSQSVSVKEATAYKIILQNTANVVYDTGLPNMVFQNGPAGGYSISSWGEI